MVDSSPTPRPTRTVAPQPPPRPAWPEHKEVGADYIGEVVDGRYRILRRLARGGMAYVFLAKHLTRKCHVALKLLHRTGADERQRFELEAQVLSNLQHEHVVCAIDYGTLDRQPYIALEYLEGETLSQRLVRGPLPWREAAAYGVQIAGALHVLHNLGIIHRDIKPDNIMLAIEADRTVAKLIDLGLASVGTPFYQAQAARFASQVTERRKTEIGYQIGTPAYLPPEAGLCEAEPRLDVYSLGVTLYQILARCLPDRGGMRPIREVCPDSDAPDDLSRLLCKALEHEVEDRLPSADHLRRGLEAILAAHPPTPTKHLYGGSYDRLEVIGVGASAVVYRASDRELERDVALKVLRAAEPSEDDAIRFRRAAKILSALHHPNIPRILHFGVHVAEGREEPFAVTELCSGAPATDYTTPDRHLRPDEVCIVGRQLASGLAAVHAIGVIYRDLHVGNVLIARGDAPQAWLYDFDHSFVSPEFYARLTGRHATPPERRVAPAREKPLVRTDYTAPEVRAGGAFSAASDVFALGLLLYRLLTGRRPFFPGHTEATPARKACPACPDGLSDLLMSMLDPDPGHRPTLAAVEEALGHAFAELDDAETAVPSKPPVEAPPSAPPVVEAPPAPADIPSESAAQASGTAASPEHVGRAETSRPRRAWAVAVAVICVLILGAVAFLLASRDDGTRVARTRVDEDASHSEVGASPTAPPPATAAAARIDTPQAHPLPSVGEALTATAPALRRCAALAGRPLILEFVVSEKSDRFAAINVVNDPGIDVGPCVREATAAIVFASTEPRIFSQEYAP